MNDEVPAREATQDAGGRDPSTPAQRLEEGSNGYRILAWVVVSACATSAVILGGRILRAGYGADQDTFLMLATWDVLRDEGTYLPSRYQGYPLAELSIGASSEIGGHWLAGAVSVALGVASLLLTYDLARRRLQTRLDAIILTSVLAATPVFVIAATTSADYIYGLTAFLAAWSLLERRDSPVLVGFLLGLATAARISYAPLGLALVLLHPEMRARGHQARATAALAITTVVAYLPTLLGAEEISAVFTADRPTGQGIAGLLGRSALKSVDVLGVAGSVVAALIVVAIWQRRAHATDTSTTNHERWLLAMLAIVVGLWIWLPVEPSYLLPGVVIALVWTSSTGLVAALRPLLLLLVAVVVAYGWWSPELVTVSYESRYGLESCAVTEASGATLSPHLDPGVLRDYPTQVAQNSRCNDVAREARSSRD
jgi:hypothetical protein